MTAMRICTTSGPVGPWNKRRCIQDVGWTFPGVQPRHPITPSANIRASRRRMARHPCLWRSCSILGNQGAGQYRRARRMSRRRAVAISNGERRGVSPPVFTRGLTPRRSPQNGGIMAQNLFNLAGRVALVTGGSKGLGKAMARAFAENGADVIISSRHENELQSALKEILDGTGRKGRYVVAAMRNRDDVKRLSRTALEQMGRVDILVNNAGTNKPQAIDAIT